MIDDRWWRLVHEIERGRASRGFDRTSTIGRLRAPLHTLADAKKCNAAAPFWLVIDNTRSGTQIGFANEAEPGAEYPRLEVMDLDRVAVARLSLSVLLDRREGLREYSLGLERQVEGRAAGYLRIDLDPPAPIAINVDDPGSPELSELMAAMAEHGRGAGACSHARLHLHVGLDPDNDDFQLRAPLPWLRPSEALTWILASVHPPLEPSPWQA